jgi:asparaginyl-tRNA synthetase
VSAGAVPLAHSPFSWAAGAAPGQAPPLGHSNFSWNAGTTQAGGSSAPTANGTPAPPVDDGVLANSPFSSRVPIARLLASGKRAIGQTITVCGWVRTNRKQKEIDFVELNDGSCLANIQCIVDASTDGRASEVNVAGASTGASLEIVGTVVESPGSQEIELKALKARLLGSVDPGTYPLAKKGHTLEFLREVAHLRPRTNTIGAVMRVRNELAFATHAFFKKHAFLYVHTPIVTASDCEGAGEMFQVTTHKVASNARYDPAADFFGRAAYLTVSGQLNGEYYACALGSIYTFGPTFRAENSHTTRHLAEFWMIEPEIAFADLTDDMNLAEAYLKACFAHVLAHCETDLQFLSSMYEKDKDFKGPKLVERLRQIVDSPFVRISYTEAIDILSAAKDKVWEFKPEWGEELQTEHERYLCEVTFKKPTIVYNYPKGCKAFYMRLNDDDRTVAAMDVLFPKARPRPASPLPTRRHGDAQRSARASAVRYTPCARTLARRHAGAHARACVRVAYQSTLSRPGSERLTALPHRSPLCAVPPRLSLRVSLLPCLHLPSLRTRRWARWWAAPSARSAWTCC